ncbi:MAG: cation:proton antiporter, partial [archaeon]
MDGLTPLTLNFAILIVTATIFVIIAKKTKQPPLIAYIFTGVALGPVILNVVTETASIELFSKLGLGFLLFLLGLEMKIKDIRKILKPIIRISLLQVIMQTSLAFTVAYLLGFPLMHTAVISLCTIFGSTPIIVKVLADQNKLKTLPGRINVGVLIIQDIILVIYLALFSTGTLTNPSIIGFTLLRVFLMIGLIGLLVIVTSRYLLSGLFGRVAENKHAFFIMGITWAFAFITLGHVLGVSIEVGAFLAGLGLGQIPFHKELQERTRPLTNFFLVIFFASIGLQLTANSLFKYWKEAIITSAVLMIGNFLIMFYLIDREKFTPRTSFLGSINMTQVSEF